MGEHVGFGADGGEEGLVRPDDERGPFGRERTHSLHTEEFRNGPVGVRQEREVEVVLLVEFALPINLIGADSRSLGPEFGELAGQVAEVAAFLRSARGHRFGVEEQHERTRLDQVGESDGCAVLIGGDEVRNPISDVHGTQPTGAHQAVRARMDSGELVWSQLAELVSGASGGPGTLG